MSISTLYALNAGDLYKEINFCKRIGKKQKMH